MIRDLDDTIQKLLEDKAEPGSLLDQANISFDLPDTKWRSGLEKLTVNCYLYDIRENRDLRTNEPIVQRNTDGTRAVRRRAPARVDCAYCITAWSTDPDEAVLEEHRLLSQVLKVLLLHPTIPPEVLQGDLVDQIPPYPTIIAAPDGVKNQPEFWGALDQQLKPSLNYVVTLAMMLDEEPTELPLAVKRAEITVNGEEVVVVAVPSVVGLPVDEAQTELTEAELKLVIGEERESDQPAGTVLEQQPAAGEGVPVGSTVTVVVAVPRT